MRSKHRLKKNVEIAKKAKNSRTQRMGRMQRLQKNAKIVKKAQNEKNERK